jgi:hypothetical protein
LFRKIIEVFELHSKYINMNIVVDVVVNIKETVHLMNLFEIDFGVDSNYIFWNIANFVSLLLSISWGENIERFKSAKCCPVNM